MVSITNYAIHESFHYVTHYQGLSMGLIDQGFGEIFEEKLTSSIVPGSLKKISGIIDLLRSLPANSIPSIVNYLIKFYLNDCQFLIEGLSVTGIYFQ